MNGERIFRNPRTLPQGPSNVRTGFSHNAAVKTYNGIYTKQDSTRDDRDWWVQTFTDATHFTAPATAGKIYWTASSERWVIEGGEDVTWEAPTTEFNALDDDRHFPGLQIYFGASPNDWQQISVSEATNGLVSVSIACIDTHFPTVEPTEHWNS
mgnify:CR=1 FL=1